MSVRALLTELPFDIPSRSLGIREESRCDILKAVDNEARERFANYGLWYQEGRNEYSSRGRLAGQFVGGGVSTYTANRVSGFLESGIVKNCPKMPAWASRILAGVGTLFFGYWFSRGCEEISGTIGTGCFSRRVFRVWKRRVFDNELVILTSLKMRLQSRKNEIVNSPNSDESQQVDLLLGYANERLERIREVLVSI